MNPMSPQRLREAAETLDAFWKSTGREYDPDVLREEADQIEADLTTLDKEARTHYTMCGASVGGNSCFVPWCTCPCHEREA